MATDDLEIISSSQNEIYMKLMNLAANGEYVSSSDEFANIDFLRSGEMGYCTEALAMMMRDSAFHKTMIYNESFLSTANMPKSIYNHAKTFNIDCIDAVPSARMATLMMKLSDIDNIITSLSSTQISEYKTKYGILENGNFMVIDKSNNIIAGNTYFSLEHSIEIYKSSSTNNSYIVKYCVDEQDVSTEYGDYSNPIIKTRYSLDGSDTYITLNVRVYQYKAVTQSKSITSSSYLDTQLHTFTYSGQICGLSLNYTKGKTTTPVNLKFSNLVSNSDSSSSDMTAYYSIIDSNTIEIKFAANSYSGIPQAGGILELKLYTTDGADGNISFTGTAIFLLEQEDYKNLAITAELDSNIITSGKDQSTLEEIRKTIINKLSTRNTIVTENDLNLWFASQVALLDNTNNSKITFRKEKDNIIKRIFAVYLLLRDGVTLASYDGDDDELKSATKASSTYISSPIPTNTIDLTVPAAELDADSESATFNITPSMKFIYNSTTRAYELSSSLSTGNDLVYVCPFNITVNYINSSTVGSYSNASYYFLDTADSTSLEITSATSIVETSIIPTTCEISRDTSEHYIVEMNVSSDKDITTGNEYVFTINNVTSSVSTDDITVSAGESDEDSGLTNYIFSIDLGAFKSANNDSINAAITTDSAVKLQEDCDFALTIKNESLHLNIAIGTSEKIHVFSALDDVMTSDIDVRTSNSAVTGFILKNVPVIAYSWYTSSINKEWFKKQLNSYITMLQENTGRLETNTFFALRFRNTYGLSNNYNTVTTNLRLRLLIHLNSDAVNSYTSSSIYQTDTTDIESALKSEIRDTVRILVDKENDNGCLRISQIIMKLQSMYYQYIDHIDFLGLNDTFNQYIKSTGSTDDTSYPLEYFCLDTTAIQDSSSGTTTNKTRLEEDIQFEMD